MSDAEDARRYRWLKSHSRSDMDDLGFEIDWHQPTENLDEKIDAAIDREKEIAIQSPPNS